LNDTTSANETIAHNDQHEDLSKHNNTVKGAKVKFAKHTHLLDHKEEKKSEKSEEKKTEVKKEENKPE
jgi:hypothetical protein